jgi:hypothetical protein
MTTPGFELAAAGRVRAEKRQFPDAIGRRQAQQHIVTSAYEVIIKQVNGIIRCRPHSMLSEEDIKDLSILDGWYQLLGGAPFLFLRDEIERRARKRTRRPRREAACSPQMEFLS